jgi:AraC-like DNA-binding protein
MLPPSEPKIKLWRPQFFPGVELEKLAAPGGTSPPIYIENYEFSINYSRRERAEGHFNYLGTTHTLGTNFSNHVLFVQSPDAIAQAELKNDGQWMFMWTLKLHPSLVKDILRQATNKRFSSPPHFANHLLSSKANTLLSKRTKQLINLFEQAGRLEAESMLYSFVLQALELCGGVRSGDYSRREQSMAQRIKHYLLDNYSSDVSLEELAQLTGLSKYQVIRTFKRDFYVTPHRFQTAVRVNRSKRLLLERRNLQEVATAVGFYDQAHFANVFKQFTHVSPSQFVRDSLSL